MENAALVTDDAVLFGILAGILALVFWTASHPAAFWRRFYSIVPALALCYCLPALLNTLGIIDGRNNGIYPIARDYLLPAALVLLTLSIDIKGLLGLGPKLLIMLFTGTLGVMLGAPIAYLIVGALSPETVAGDTWSGMAALAGSWIGGGANMVAMREIYEVDANTFGQFAAADILVASVWLAGLLFLAGRAQRFDRWIGADTRAIDELKDKVEAYQLASARIPTLADVMVVLGLAFTITGLAHALAGPLSSWIAAEAPQLARLSLTSRFFWIVIFATTIAIGLSFTRARKLEDVGASRLGTAMLYVLIVSIGMQMDLMALVERPWLFAIGAIWILIHGAMLLFVARLIRAPAFYFAIGSQGNIGAAASAPVVAAAFHPALAPVGVLLGVVGYATGTYLAWVVGQMLRVMAGA